VAIAAMGHEVPVHRAIMVAMSGRSEVSSTAARVPAPVRTPTCERAAVHPGEGAGDPGVAEIRLLNRPESAQAARRLAREVLQLRWGVPGPLIDDAVLLVSELVGNAVRHTGASVFGLRMQRGRDGFRVEVRDPSRGLPCLLPVQPLDTSGRGLAHVEALADRWGVDLLPHGKCTWFEIRLGRMQAPR
jgi:anti-sigma regulatory factor (Ser/Thr protein kinase)